MAGLDWPFNFVTFGVIIAIVAALLWNMAAARAMPFATAANAFQLLVICVAIWVMAYAHLEYGARRQMVLDALSRTAGALEFGAVLSRVVAQVASNAGVARSANGLEPDLGQATAIVARRLDIERSKRDHNREMFGICLAVVAATFAVVAAFGGFRTLLGVDLDFDGHKATVASRQSILAKET
jgi:hypothetical protein